MKKQNTNPPSSAPVPNGFDPSVANFSRVDGLSTPRERAGSERELLHSIRLEFVFQGPMSVSGIVPFDRSITNVPSLYQGPGVVEIQKDGIYIVNGSLDVLNAGTAATVNVQRNGDDVITDHINLPGEVTINRWAAKLTKILSLRMGDRVAMTASESITGGVRLNYLEVQQIA